MTRWRVGLFVFLLVLPRPASAAIGYVASSSWGSTNTNGASSQASMNTTGANYLGCAIADYNANSPSTITENLHSSAPTGYTSAPSVGQVQARLAYWINYSGGNPTTFTTSGTGTYAAIACIAMSSVDITGSAFEAASAGGTQATGTTVQPGTLTPAAPNEMVVTVQGMNSDTSETIDSGFGVNGGNPVTGGAVAGTAFGASIAYSIQTTATATNPIWTGAATTQPRVAISATFLCGNCGGGATGTAARHALVKVGR